MTDLPGHVGKVTSDKKMIFVSHQKHKRRIRDYFGHFSVIFKTLSKFLIVFVRLILEKWFDGFTRPQREIDTRYEFDLKVNLKSLGCDQ